MEQNQAMEPVHQMFMEVAEHSLLEPKARNNMNDGNNNLVIYGKSKKGKTSTEKTTTKGKHPQVSHGTSTNYKARGSMNPSNVKVKVDPKKKKRKVLTDGGYAYI